MINFYQYLKPLIFQTDPEKAHCLALQSIKHNYIFDYQVQEYMKSYFSQNICGIQFDSPIGLAAGFDKNGELTGKIHLITKRFDSCKLKAKKSAFVSIIFQGIFNLPKGIKKL